MAACSFPPFVSPLAPLSTGLSSRSSALPSPLKSTASRTWSAAPTSGSPSASRASISTRAPFAGPSWPVFLLLLYCCCRCVSIVSTPPFARTSYEPELFPGLIYKMISPKVTLLIFVRCVPRLLRVIGPCISHDGHGDFLPTRGLCADMGGGARFLVWAAGKWSSPAARAAPTFTRPLRRSTRCVGCGVAGPPAIRSPAPARPLYRPCSSTARREPPSSIYTFRLMYLLYATLACVLVGLHGASPCKGTREHTDIYGQPHPKETINAAPPPMAAT